MKIVLLAIVLATNPRVQIDDATLRLRPVVQLKMPNGSTQVHQKAVFDVAGHGRVSLPDGGVGPKVSDVCGLTAEEAKAAEVLWKTVQRCLDNAVEQEQ